MVLLLLLLLLVEEEEVMVMVVVVMQMATAKQFLATAKKKNISRCQNARRLLHSAAGNPPVA